MSECTCQFIDRRHDVDCETITRPTKPSFTGAKMSLAREAINVGTLLLEHADILEDVRDAVRAGVTKDALKAAIKQLQTQISDAAITEELTAADERQKNMGF